MNQVEENIEIQDDVVNFKNIPIEEINKDEIKIDCEKRVKLTIGGRPSRRTNYFIGEYFEKNCQPEEILEGDVESLADSQEIIINKPLFKKTISRMVAMQMFATILGDDLYFKHCGKESLNSLIDEIMKFVIENNNYEWSYFRNKQISKNFAIQLVKFLNENFHLISTKLLKCAAIYRYNHVMKAIVYGVIGEYLMIQSVENTDQKDYKNILINEYILIAEYFLDENHVKLLNGVLEGLFAEMKKVDEIVETGSVELDNIEVEVAEVDSSELDSIFENNNANLIVEKSGNDENKIDEEAICANIMSANIINSNAESICA